MITPGYLYPTYLITVHLRSIIVAEMRIMSSRRRHKCGNKIGSLVLLSVFVNLYVLSYDI